MSLGKTWWTNSLGRGREDKNALDEDGTVDEEENSLLYEDRLPWHSSGDLCGELYSAMDNKPRENMSAADVRLLSMTKSGDVKSRLSWTNLGSRGSMLRTSPRLMPWIDVGFVEPSAGVQNDRPLSFQSDWSHG